MASKWNLIVDVERCDNCRLCFLAVKDEYIGNEFAGYSAAQPVQGHNWLEIRRKERGAYPLVEARFMPVMCNHCDAAPCIEAARDGAVRKRPDGIVIIDPEKSRGQQQIVDACPYGAICWNEERQVPQAWPFDAHLLDGGWTRTRGEQACPAHVYRTIKVEDEEMQRLQSEEGLEVLKPELGTRPRVYYKNLHVMTKCFAGGTVVRHVKGVEECAAGVEVVLEQDGRRSDARRRILSVSSRSTGSSRTAAAIGLKQPAQSERFSIEFDLGDESRYLGVMTLAAAS